MKTNHRDKSSLMKHSKKSIPSKKYTEEQEKNHKEYVGFLKARFGKHFNLNNKKISCSYSSIGDPLITNDFELKTTQDKYDRAYELTKEYIGKHKAGIKSFSTMTRRTYLKNMGLFLTAVAVPFATSACSPPCCAFSEQEGQIGSSVPGPTDQASVAMVKGGASIEDDVRAAVNMAGGLGDIMEGDSVLIKPNCVTADGKQASAYSHMEDGPVATNPEVIRAVIRMVKERNNAPEKIFIADHASFMADTLDIMIQLGVFDVAMEEGVNVMPWEQTDSVCYRSDKFQYLDYPVHISTTVQTFDHFINVPEMTAITNMWSHTDILT